MNVNSKKRRGKVLRWFRDSGYGFIEGRGGKDLFVHASNVLDRGPRFLVPGERVEYEISTGRKDKPEAVNVLVLERDVGRAEILAAFASLEAVEDGYCSACGGPVLPGEDQHTSCGARLPRISGEPPFTHSASTAVWDAEEGQLVYEEGSLLEMGIGLDSIAAHKASFAK